MVEQAVKLTAQLRAGVAELLELRAAYGELASIPPLPPADATYPSLVLTAPPALLSALR